MFTSARFIVAMFMMFGLSAIASQAQAQAKKGSPSRGDFLKQLKASDKNKDGKITKAELPERMQRMFGRMDSNGDGVIDKKEVAAVEKRFAGRKGSSKPSSAGVPAGKPAPDFTLKTLDGKKEVKLSSFQGKRPVALIFGSYT